MHRVRHRLASAVTLLAVTVSSAALSAPNAVAEASMSASMGPRGVYVVVLRGSPLASYAGGVAGYRATAPAPGHRFDAVEPAVLRYRAYLRAQQSKVLALVGSPQPLYSYTTALDGFAVALTDLQAKQLRLSPQVVSIEPDSIARLDGQPDSQAAESRVGAPPARAPSQSAASALPRLSSRATAGRGTVIGVVDSGIWPENPSFAGIPIDARTLHARYPGFTGSCSDGERWSPDTCSTKVLAARYFVAGFGPSHVAAADYLSPRDPSGHGSHVAGTAAGNAGVPVTIQKQDFGNLSGMAPAAALAIYKACWTAPDPVDDGCTVSDSVAAVDAAVSDGVDVLNYSASSSDAAPNGALEQAFRGAAAAGVFVATSAGDTGLTGAPIAHPSPWVTTVGASSHDPYLGSVRLGNGDRYVGAMVSDTDVPASPLVYARTVPARGASGRQAALCYPGSLDARAVRAAIVICDRGVTARVAKSAAVAQAGGIAMVLVNRGPGSTDADFHSVPTVHLNARDGRAIKSYLAAATRPTATLRAHSSADRPLPAVAAFSASGPAPSSDGSILKPDVTAPGVSVVAAVAPPANFGRLWDLYSGTSMATAAVSGLAAGIRSEQPLWSPAAIKSAMMTTASPIPGAGPWEQGAGDIRPEAATDPGLVYETVRTAEQRYLRALAHSVAVQVPSAVSSRASQLNSAALAVGRLVGDVQLTRTVTNVSASTETYVARLNRPRGIAMAVDPATFTLAPGKSQTFTVALSARQPARYERFATGSLTWRGSAGHTVTSPVVVRPELVDAPTEVTATGRSGGVSVVARSGVTGVIKPVLVGLVGAAPRTWTLAPGAFTPTAPAASASTAFESVDVPAKTSVLRLDLRAGTRGDDLDLYIYRAGRLVGSADSSASGGQVTLLDPAAGRYAVYVNAAASATGASASAQLTSWVVPRGSTARGALTKSRLPTTGGRRFAVDARWSKLAPTERYFGYVAYRGSDRRTFLTVD